MNAVDRKNTGVRQILTLVLFMNAAPLHAGLSFEPYFSYRSTKSVSPQRKTNSETETIKNREEKGIRASLSFYRLLRIAGSVGQSFVVTTKKQQEMTDEYGEIDFDADLNNDPSVLGKDLKKKETDTRANVSLFFDPSFSIFVARFKAGVTARQRKIKVFENDVEILKKEPAFTFKPVAGAGLGVRFSSNLYAIVDYSFYFYKFPETEPFERALSLSVGVNL